MADVQPRYGKEEFAQRGDRWYEQLHAQIAPGNRGKIVAIDIETGKYEVAEDTVMASDRLLGRIPDAQIWFVRIGHRAVHRLEPVV